MASVKKRATRKDVAQAAGVSPSLVTYALDPAGKHPVNAVTRDRICRIAAELDYVPSFSGRSLKSQHSFNIALVMPQELVHSISLYYLQLFQSFCGAINNTEYQPVVFLGVDEKLFQRIKERRVDAVVLLNGLCDFPAKYGKLFENDLPKVFLNSCYSCREPYTSSVNCDHADIAVQGLNKLAAAGCRNLLAITGNMSCYANRVLSDTWNKWGKQHDDIKLHRRTNPLSMSQIEHENLDSLLGEILHETCLPDGIFCDGELSRHAIIEFYRKNALELPEHFWIDTVTADNNVWVQQPELLGQAACSEALRMLKNKDPQGRDIVIPYKMNDTKNQ